MTAKISSVNTSIGYHNFADVSKTWCIKIMDESDGNTDTCINEGANRIAFGTGRASFAAAFIELLSQNVGKL